MKLLNLAVAAAFLSALVALTGCESPESVFGRFDADGNEVWRCSGSTSQVDHIVLTRHLLNDRDIGTGTVRAAGVTYRTVFRTLERTALPLWLARLSRMTTPKRGISS